MKRRLGFWGWLIFWIEIAIVAWISFAAVGYLAQSAPYPASTFLRWLGGLTVTYAILYALHARFYPWLAKKLVAGLENNHE